MKDDDDRNLPDDFFLSFADQVAYWGDPLVAMLLEEFPGCPLFEHFAKLSAPHGSEILNRLWGQPDLGALRRMTGAFREEIGYALNVSEDIVEALEFGLVPMRLNDAIALCRYFHWPLAALYRDGYGPHRFTELVETFGVEI